MIKLYEIRELSFIPFKELLLIIKKNFNCSLKDIKKINSLTKYKYIVIFKNYDEYILYIDYKHTLCGEIIIHNEKINQYCVYSS